MHSPIPLQAERRRLALDLLLRATDKKQAFYGCPKRALGNLQYPDLLPLLSESSVPQIILVDGETAVSRWGSKFVAQGYGDSAHTKSPGMTLPAHARDLTVQGLKLIQDGFPVLASALNELINAVFVADDSSSLGGSRSDRVGILWISPQAGWTSTTYAEAIAHECVHTAIFLQDMVFGLYVMDEDELAQAGGLVTSAIRRTPRRFDLAFHSAFVAYTLSSFYRELNEREKADSYIAPLIVCLRDLSQKSWLLSDLGKQMLRELIEQTLLWTNTSQKNSLPMV